MRKECIRELLREYPELTGMGTCPGENMPMSAAANAEWIRDVYLDTLAKTGRKIPFIYRYWGARPKETVAMLEKAEYPGEILLDIKFNGEHMYSSAKPHPEEMGMAQADAPSLTNSSGICGTTASSNSAGETRVAGKTLTNCGGPDSAGFVMGSETRFPAPTATTRRRPSPTATGNTSSRRTGCDSPFGEEWATTRDCRYDYWIDRFF